MRQILADLDRERPPSAVIALPDLARRCVRTLELALDAAAKADEPRGGGVCGGGSGGGGIGPNDEVYEPEDDDTKAPPRRRHVNTTSRIRTVEDWEALRDRLDSEIRRLLAEGFEVELDG